MGSKTTIKTYTELVTLSSFLERYRYLRIGGAVGAETFGFERYLNQTLYRSAEWKRVRDLVILRDNGCDLGLNGHEIGGRILVHHLNPITAEDIRFRRRCVLDLDNLICVSHETHNAIHYGDERLLLPSIFIERTKNDTCPWKK